LAKRKAHGDHTPKQVSLQPGDHVMVDRPNAKKLEERWEGPFEVADIQSSTATVQHYGSPKKFHISRTKASKITPKSFEDIPEAEEEEDPDLSLEPKDLIGKRVLVWWPSMKNWYKGRVITHKGKRHLVRYDERSSSTPDDEDESYWEYLLGSKRCSTWKILVPKKGSTITSK
jgi:hypothetical protein